MAESVIGTLVYKITGDTNALEKGMDVSRQKISKTGDSLVELGKKAARVGTVIFSGIFVKSCLEAASRVEELGNKFDTVFSGMEATADAWARKYADDTNRGVTATKEFLATQQDLRTGYGDAVESAARFSQAVVGVTNDLASFSNVPVADAMASIQSGLAGNFQSLKTLGVGLNEQIINEGAYAKALGKTWSAMNNLERQEAILSGIMSQSKNAIHQNVQVWTDYNYQLGDAALTSDSFANSVQGAQQRLEDLKAELGDSLIPIATDVLSVVIDGVKWFNSWDDSSQRLSVSLLAVGAAVYAIEGPVGWVVGILGGLLVLFSDNRSAVDDLEDSTRSLKSITGEYNEVTKKLSENTDSMTASERKLYEIQQKRLKLEIDSQMAKVAESYASTTKEVNKLTDAEQREQGRLEATRKILEGLGNGNLVYAQEEYSRLVEMAESGQRLSGYQAGLWQQYSAILNDANEALRQSQYDSNALGDIVVELEDAYEFIFKSLPEKAENAQNANLNLEESVLNLAIAYKNGTLDIEKYRSVYPELVADIEKAAADISDSSGAIGGSNDKIKQAIEIGRRWRDQRKSQEADIREQNKEYQKAADLRIELLEDEQKAGQKALAVSAGIIKEEEELTEEALKAALGSNSEFAEEYYSLNRYYSAEIAAERKKASDSIQSDIDAEKKAEEDLAKTREQNAASWIGKLRQQDIAMRESEAAARESEGDITGAFAIRLDLLNEEEQRELEILQGKVNANEASENDIKKLREYYANERDKLQTRQADAEKAALDKAVADAKAAAEKQRKAEEDLAKARDANAAVWVDKLRRQSDAARENAASELEASGNIREAYAIRLDLIDQEEQRELEALQAKMDAHEATEQDKTNLQAYYANERQKLAKQEADAEAEIVEKNLQKQTNTWKSFLSGLKGLVSGFGSAYMNLYSVMTDNAIAEIDRQTQARLEALDIAEKSEIEKLQDEYDEAVKAGDMKLAREKQDAIQRIQIEEDADKEKAELQRQQAERERDLRIFTTTLDMLSAIVKYLADPGGWAGVGLSAMAATTGAMQLAAIKAESLPSFDVGVNYVPEDMLAMIHQGETILPAPMAESVRKGDAVFGQVQVQVNIENYSTETVDVSDAMDDQALTITIGKAVEKGISSGRYDSALGSRYGIRKVGRNVR